MLAVTWSQRSNSADVMGQATILIIIIHIYCQAGAENRCAGGVCSNQDNGAMAESHQPISDTQVRPRDFQAHFVTPIIVMLCSHVMYKSLFTNRCW